MSLKDIEEKSGKERIQLDSIPEYLAVTVTSAMWKPDENKKECLYVEYTTDDERVFVQKYSEMHLKDLAEAMQTLEISELKTGLKLQLRKKAYRIGFPRMYPTEIL